MIFSIQYFSILGATIAVIASNDAVQFVRAIYERIGMALLFILGIIFQCKLFSRA